MDKVKENVKKRFAKVLQEAVVFRITGNHQTSVRVFKDEVVTIVDSITSTETAIKPYGYRNSYKIDNNLLDFNIPQNSKELVSCFGVRRLATDTSK